MSWNVSDYAANAAFVPALGEAVLDLLGAGPQDRVLDLGCGDGVLTEKLAATGAQALGVDTSQEMLEAAKARGLEVRLVDGQALPFLDEFSAVFTNAALHWMPDQRAVAEGVFRALRPGGRYVGECGGHMNIAAIRTALRSTLERHGFSPDAAGGQTYLPADEFRRLHEEAGFIRVEPLILARPTPLPTGIRGWLTTFRGGFLADAGVPHNKQEAIIDEIEALLRPILCDREGNWTADYVRLRWRAEKPR